VPNSIYQHNFFAVIPATAAGTSVVSGTTGVDMLGFEGCLIIAAMNTLTAGQVTTLQALDSATNGSFVAITNAITPAMADADSGKLMVIDVYRPVKRWLSAQVNRATQNAVIDRVIMVQYNTKKAPSVLASGTNQVSVSKFYIGGA
jgi:hypothetical protein